MQIMNNSATMAALGEFKKNDTTLGKELKKVASGMKLNSAGDDASAYAISERMRTNIRALSQATDNVKTGQSLLRVASAAIDHQVGLLQQVAVRTMQASDDTYTDKDRATLNKEISQLLDESDDIAYETTYNGRHLLDQTEMGKVEGAYTFLSNNTYTANAPSKIAVKVLEKSDYDAYDGFRYIEPSFSPSNLYDTSDPTTLQKGDPIPLMWAFGLEDGMSVWNADANAVDTVRADTSTPWTTYYFVNTGQPILINGYVGATRTNVCNILYTKPYTSIPAKGTTVTYTPNGHSMYTDPYVTSRSYYEGLSFSGTIDTFPGTTTPAIKAPTSIDTGVHATAMLDFSTLFSSVKTFPDNLEGVNFSFTCNMGCGQYVSFALDTTSASSSLYVGTASVGLMPPMCYRIGVKNVTSQQDFIETFFNGISEAGATNSRWSGHSDTPHLTLGQSTSAPLASKHSIALDYYASCNMLAIHEQYGYGFTLKNGLMGELVKSTRDACLPQQHLVLQSGTKSGEKTKLLLANTTTSVLFLAPDAWPDGTCPPVVSDFDRNHCVDTRDKASTFLNHVQNAIEYLLDSNTTIGAQISRLDYTASNLTTSTENTQSSESTIRDADMAKEMTAYTKANVLAQSAQAMLAQANQNASSVLELLQ